ncbi:YhjD/YihY/BrkB family envelope integrity protein [Klenkia sp. PcliD-1-E]|uniref:YhjD/YihY/BrkB family envelope integrity protein n=1 Tax=Klenkia sp. PcliD-1-E TaxID=2954492 RepID=UPI002096992D|nr:YhjD/YihY/BrkB family envelope integrity protein [Klenkia sp. PcliD-1-E]MCO7218236.1 YihY/virulence factor BrkB family protein [Klenkia sp. PcliD-1-E]
MIRWRAEVRFLMGSVRRGLRGRDLSLIAAGLTFYAGISVVPLLLLAVALTSLLTSPEAVRRYLDTLGGVLPDELGAPDALAALAEAGTTLTWLGGVLALLPMTFYGEGLRRALLRFTDERDTYTGWRGRLAVVPLLLVSPLLLYPVLLVVPVLADLQTGGTGSRVAEVAVGFYAVLFALVGPLVWGFRVVAAGMLRWRAIGTGAFFTAASLAGFLQGFMLFLRLPLSIGAPFGGLEVVGGVVALGLWLFLLHLVVIAGWLLTQALDERLARGAPPARPTPAAADRPDGAPAP